MSVITYTAHIITADVQALGDPEVIVMTHADETGVADAIAHYPLIDSQDPLDVLAGNGWRVIGDTTDVETGYVIVDVEAESPAQIVRHVTFAKTQADSEAKRQEIAWRAIIRSSMLEGASATNLATAASISRERIYQIRDDRR